VFRADKARDFRSVVLSVPCNTAIERERERERERIKHSVVQKQQDDRKLMHVDNPMLAETPCANCELHISGCE
jgi:hypothetical protein